MSEIDLMQEQATPTLTFEPFGATQEVAPVPAAEPEQPAAPVFDESNLSPETSDGG